MIKLRHLAAASAAVLTLAVAVPPASAQWIVYDPTNFGQNVLTAARERPTPPESGLPPPPARGRAGTRMRTASSRPLRRVGPP